MRGSLVSRHMRKKKGVKNMGNAALKLEELIENARQDALKIDKIQLDLCTMMENEGNLYDEMGIQPMTEAIGKYTVYADIVYDYVRHLEAKITELENLAPLLADKQDAKKAERAQYVSERNEFEAAKELTAQGLPVVFARFVADGDKEKMLENISVFKAEYLKAIETGHTDNDNEEK